MKDIKTLTIGTHRSIRYKILKCNPVSLKTQNMVLSIIIICGATIVLFFLSQYTKEDQLIIDITMCCAVSIIIAWVFTICDLSLINYTNYIGDCLLILPTDKNNNQHGYFNVINKQLQNYLNDNDIHSFNSNLIQVTKFINKPNKFFYCYDYCIKTFLDINDIEQYLYFLKYTYQDIVRYYRYNGHINRNSFSVPIPIDNIEKFQNYMFASNFNQLENFFISVVKNHTRLKAKHQSLLLDYYLWVLDNLCHVKHEYSFIFALDILRNFKNSTDAREFLVDAMKVALNHENNKAIDGLFRAYFLYIVDSKIDYYIKNKNGNTAWMFKDLIHLTIVYTVLNLQESTGYTCELIILTDLFFKITVICSKDPEIFVEWLAYIYCQNKIWKNYLITEEKLIKANIEAFLTSGQLSSLRKILNNDPEEIIIADAESSKFTRAINDDHDFFEHPKIREYREVFKSIHI